MRKKPPPPPRRPKYDEGATLAQWDSRIRAYSKRVRRPGRLGMSREDVEQDLRLCLLQVLRKYAAANSGEEPHGSLLTVVLQRRVLVLNRDSRVEFRATEDGARSAWEADPTDRIPDTFDDPAEAMTQEALAEACEALVYAIQHNVPPAMFVILHLRVIEELTPTEIAAISGIDTNTKASKRINYAKQMAVKFLRGIGIHAWEDVPCASLEDLDG